MELWNFICLTVRMWNKYTRLLAWAVVLCCNLCTKAESREAMFEQDAGDYICTLGDFSVRIAAATGGRITSMRRNNSEFLLQDTVHPKYYGATLWVSPQCHFWPQSPILDTAPYQVKSTRRSLILTSRKDSITGLQFKKHFTISKDTVFVIDYRIKNMTDTVRHIAAWDVVRVLDGTAFFPVKERDLDMLLSDLEPVYEQDGILWYTGSGIDNGKGQKLFATTTEGWLAYRSGNLLFIKIFPMVAEGELPYMQGEVEIFLAPHRKYMELENHSGYVALRPGGTLHYRQKWYLCHIPDEFVRNTDMLVSYVRKRIGLCQ